MEDTTAGLVDRLRADLTGFTVSAVEDLLGPLANRALGREQSLPAQRAVSGRTEPVAVLLRCFVLGDPVPAGALERALPGLTLAGARRLGLVETAGDGPDDEVRALADLRPYAAVDDVGPVDWWLVSDPGELATGRPLRPDHVLGVGGASVTLARSTVRRRVDRVLDLGTGCGIQAVHAGRHAGSVVGTDISRRALRMARLNWRLNADTLGGATFDAVPGSMLEPVQGQQFDLVVSNPPFVITPRAADAATYEYRDGGLVGDRVVQQLIEGLGAVLAPGGVAQLLGNWEIHGGEDWDDRVAAWAGADLDSWIVQREVQDPAQYAETWVRDAGQHLGPDADALYEAWLDDFAARGVDSIGFGLITLRRPVDGGPGRHRAEDRRSGSGLPTGAEVLTHLAALDWLRDRDDEGLLAAGLAVAPDVTEERHHMPGAADPAVILLRQGGAGQRLVQASTGLAGLVGACSGDLTVGQLISALAMLLEVEEASLRAELLPQVRELVLDGMLLPVP